MKIIIPPAGNLSAATIEIDPDIRTQCALAITAAQCITDAAGPNYDVASRAMRSLAKLRTGIESARKAIKEEPLDLCRRIDAVAKEASGPIEAEENRVRQLIAKETEALFRRQREAKEMADRARQEIERKAREEADRIRREAEEKARAEQERIARAEPDLDALEAALVADESRKKEAEARAEKVRVEATEVARKVDQYVAPKAVGHSSRMEIDYDITDLRVLAREHPYLVDIAPRRALILAQLKAGLPVAGVIKTERVAVRIGSGR